MPVRTIENSNNLTTGSCIVTPHGSQGGKAEPDKTDQPDAVDHRQRKIGHARFDMRDIRMPGREVPHEHTAKGIVVVLIDLLGGIRRICPQLSRVRGGPHDDGRRQDEERQDCDGHQTDGSSSSESEVREQGDRRELGRDGDRERSSRQQYGPRFGSVVGEHHQRDDQEMDVAEAQFLGNVSPDDQECDEEHLPSPFRQTSVAGNRRADVPHSRELQREERESRKLQRQPSERNEQECDGRQISEPLRGTRRSTVRLDRIELVVAGNHLASRAMVDGEIDGASRGLSSEQHEKDEQHRQPGTLKPDQSDAHGQRRRGLVMMSPCHLPRRAVLPGELVQTNPDEIGDHAKAIADHPYLGIVGVTPSNGHLTDAQPAPRGQEENLRIEAKAVDGLFLEDRTRPIPVEQLEPALRVVKLQPETDAHQAIEHEFHRSREIWTGAAQYNVDRWRATR